MLTFAQLLKGLHRVICFVLLPVLTAHAHFNPTVSNYNYTANEPTGISDAAVCTGETVNLPGACAIGTLKWYQSDQTTVISEISVSPAGTTAYYARCEGPTGNSGWVEMTVTVNAKPTASVNNGTLSCATPSVMLTANGSEGVTYSWTGPGGFSASTKEVMAPAGGAMR